MSDLLYTYLPECSLEEHTEFINKAEIFVNKKCGGLYNNAKLVAILAIADYLAYEKGVKLHR